MILVRKQTALISDECATVVITDQIRFSRTQKSMSQKKPTKWNSVLQAVFLKAAGEYEQFANPYFGHIQDS